METPAVCSQTSKSASAARKRSCRTRCQVVGCSAYLSLAKVYCQRRHLCETHMQAESVLLEGGYSQLHRFCFQCGKLQQLECFDGLKRTCRSRLQKRRESTSGKKRAVPCSVNSEAESTEDANCCSTPVSSVDCSPQALSTLSPDCSTDMTLPAATAAAAVGDGSSCLVATDGMASAGVCSVSSSSSSSQQTGWDAAINGTAACAFGCAPADQASCFGCAQEATVLWSAGAQAVVSASPSKTCGQLLTIQPWESVGDAASLELMLESELTAAALQAAIAAGNQQPLDPESQELSRMLAAALVEDSGLFDEPMGTPSLALLSQESCNMSSAVPAARTCSPAAQDTPNTVPAAAAAAAGSWDLCSLGCAAYPAACAGLPCASLATGAGCPAGQGPAAGAACAGAAAPSLVPCSAAALMGTASLLAPCTTMNSCTSAGPQASRLALLNQQMAQLHARVEYLRCQLAL